MIVEDTSLYFNAWNKLPGPLIKWFLEGMGLEGLVKALSPFEDKSAHAVCCLALTDDGKNIHFFEGKMNGLIVVISPFFFEPKTIPHALFRLVHLQCVVKQLEP